MGCQEGAVWLALGVVRLQAAVCGRRWKGVGGHRHAATVGLVVVVVLLQAALAPGSR